MNCCTHDCNQGRACPERSLPLHREWSETEDEPVLTMDPIEYAIWAVIAASLAIIVWGVASAWGAYWPTYAF